MVGEVRAPDAATGNSAGRYRFLATIVFWDEDDSVVAVRVRVPIGEVDMRMPIQGAGPGGVHKMAVIIPLEFTTMTKGSVEYFVSLIDSVGNESDAKKVTVTLL